MRLEVERISHRYDRLLAVDDVTFSVDRGETLCLLGPSGCGKSTLLRLIAGLEEVQRGRIQIDGDTVAGAGRSVPAEARGVGMVFQDYALFPHLSVLANAAFGLDHLAPGERTARAQALLAQMGLERLARAYPHTLSGGEQQRVALARALAPEPRVLLLDEPFAGLDVRLRGRLREETLHLLRARGITTILVTHDPEEAMFMGDRIAVLFHGRIVQAGTPVELYRHPNSAFVARFFGETSSLTGRVLGGRVVTPVGSFPAPGAAEGSEVEVILRPEAVHLVDDGAGDAFAAAVVAAHALGPASLLDLAIGDGGALQLMARVPGHVLPPPGARVQVTVDHAQALVFALDRSAQAT